MDHMEEKLKSFSQLSSLSQELKLRERLENIRILAQTYTSAEFYHGGKIYVEALREIERLATGV